MEPVYMNMQSYPHQNSQIHYRPRCYHGMEARPPMSYECWPWGGNYGYAPPGACHGCCNHVYAPAHYAWGSPYSHVPPHHCPGNYPYFPVQYMPRPPYNVMEQPRYEYEKNVPMEHHCCGCSNHPLHQKEQRKVRIEEEEPKRERRRNYSVVPSQFKENPYPIVWLPPDYMEPEKVKNTEGVKDDASRDVKEHENGKTVNQQPTFWNGWLPPDLNNVVSSKQRGDGEENPHQDGGKQNFQFPLFWMPYKPEDTGRENQKVINAKPSLELENGSGSGQNIDVARGNIGDQSTSRVKDIPVKEVKEHIGKESSTNQEKEGDTSAKVGTDKGERKIDNVERVSPTEGSKRKSLSSPKSSKLPPVCLRVDPLPRKKSANAKSWSPSPPGDKQKLEAKFSEAEKVRSSDNEEQVKGGMDKKTIAVADGNSSLEKSTKVNVKTLGKLPARSQDDVPTKQAEEKQEEEIAQKHSETDAVIKEQSEDIASARGEKEEIFKAGEMKADSVKKCSKRELSEEEAAVIIQSAYHGFDVRRWKPIEKLKEIARVREQMADVKRHIQEMELSSDIQGRAMQKNIIAETIMSLLLRLDTIQGLHPSIREIRKSEVRELVSLQEQLDKLMNEKPESSPEQESVMRHDQEDVSSKSEDVVVSSEDSSTISPVDLLNQIDGGSNPERAELLEANPIDEAASVKIGMEAAESSLDEGVKSARGPTIKDEGEKSSEVLENNETSIAKEDREATILGKGSELSSLQDESSAGATNLAPTDDHDTLQSELPQGVLDDLCTAEGTNHSIVEADSSKADQSKQLEETFVESPTFQESHYGVANEENQQTMETHEVTDLPLNGVGLETKETGDNSKLDCKSGTEEEVDSKKGDAAQPPENFIADNIGPSEASDERELPTTGDKSHENTVMADSMMEEPPESLLQEGDVEETDLTIAEQSAADMNHSAGGVSEMGMVSKQGLECNTEHHEAIEKRELEDAAEHEENNAVEVSPTGGDRRESDRKLIEENERLRERMEKMIKSGHEQLMAISSLFGRVKDLEKKLSRKKKLKVKQFRGPRSSCMTKFDGYDGERVAM